MQKLKSRILLLSAYDAQSHQLWRKNLASLFPDIDWQQLALPPRHFSWRVRGNSLQWAYAEAAVLSQEYDLLLATSMVDLAALRGLVPSLSRLPTLVYFHENQFVYPPGNAERDNIEPRLVPLYSALCADRIVFNSEFNRRSFLNGARSLLKRLPDRFPDSIMQQLEASITLPVPVYAPDEPGSIERDPTQLEVVWNHRWEYDKGLDLLLAVTEELVSRQLPIRLYVVGQRFRSVPAQLGRIQSLLEEHASRLETSAGCFGYLADRRDYDALLHRCDVVLSTALHDFQGLALQEACLAGCTPLAPADLVYPEYLDRRFLFEPEAIHGDSAR